MFLDVVILVFKIKQKEGLAGVEFKINVLSFWNQGGGGYLWGWDIMHKVPLLDCYCKLN